MFQMTRELWCGYLEDDDTTTYFVPVVGWTAPDDGGFPLPLTRDGWKSLNAEDGETVNFIGMFTFDESQNRHTVKEAVADHIKYRRHK